VIILIRLYEVFGGEVRKGNAKQAVYLGSKYQCQNIWEGLGFRDMELFNLSLLAREAWQILEDTDMLSARILKSLYYPSVDFLEADLGSAPSQIWRAIVEGKDILKLGLIRRTRDGRTMRI
jgi:hypothetical protein